MSGGVDFEGRREGHVEFHNTGLYNLAGALSYPPPNTGIYEITKKPEDVGRFKAPTLRNIAVTAPYMHDGSAADPRRRAGPLRRRGPNHRRRREQGHRPRQSQQESGDRRVCPERRPTRGSRRLSSFVHRRGTAARCTIRQSVDSRFPASLSASHRVADIRQQPTSSSATEVRAPARQCAQMAGPGHCLAIQSDYSQFESCLHPR